MVLKKGPKKGRKAIVGSLAVLALLEHETEDGWTSEKVAKVVGISPWTVRHHLQRLRRYGQAHGEIQKRMVAYRLKNDSPERADRQIEVRTLIWTCTPKGEKRQEFRGGHEFLCPVCRKKGQKVAANPKRRKMARK